MKKLLFLIAFGFIAQLCYSQTKIITMTNGTKYEGLITREDDMNYYFIQKNDTTDKVISIPKIRVSYVEDFEVKKDSVLIFTKVVQVPGVSKSELYKRAKKYIVESYKSANDVIQLDDAESGELILKGVARYSVSTFLLSSSGYYNHTLKIYCKDGKFKYSFENIMYHPIGSYSSGEYPIESLRHSNSALSAKILEDVNLKFNEFSLQLENYIKNYKEDDW